MKEGGNGVRVAWKCGLRAAAGAERESRCCECGAEQVCVCQ